MTSWVPRGHLIHPRYVRPHVIRLLQDHFLNTARSILNWSFMSNFPFSVAPFIPWGRDLWVEGPVGWRFYLALEKLAHLCQASLESFMTQDTWRSMIGHSLRLKCPFVFCAIPLYKPTFLLSFLYFQLKSTIRAPSSLSDKRTRPVTASIVNAPSPFIFQFWWVFSHSHLEENFPFLHFILS